VNHELIGAIDRIAVESLAAQRVPADDPQTRVKALDLWSDEPNGAVLFWVDGEADLCSDGEPVLHEVYAKHIDGAWRPTSWGNATSEPLDELLARCPPGLHRVGGSSLAPVFLTWAIATPEVALVRLRNADGEVQERPPGRHGFVLLGISSEDPLTYASAVNQAGEQLPGEPLPLWAPPRDTAINA
jgi:hypothetical protein